MIEWALIMNVSFFLQQLDSCIWQPLFVVLMVMGLYLTWRLRGLQFRELGYSLKLAFTRHDYTAVGDISNFQALMTALAATIGIGNIAGIATAIAVGGMGSLFWLWVTSLIGMATKYAEGVLAIKYRKVDDQGGVKGGPMYYLSEGLGWKKMAVAFSFFGAITTIATGNLVQSNSIASAISNYLPISPMWVGVLLAICTAAVILGGIKSIGKVTAYLVPFMALFYLLACFLVIALNFSSLPQAIFSIFSCAFTGQAATGGFVGSTILVAMQMGLARGIFSNESGLGSSPIAAAAARTDHAARQALISMAGAFLSTVVCTFTGIVIAVSNVLGDVGPTGELLSGAYMTVVAFERAFPYGGLVVIISCILFGLSTIMGWSYYGEKCCEYLFGSKSVGPYRFIYTLCVMLGVMIPVDMLWSIADIANAFMAMPNIAGVLALTPVLCQETRLFFRTVRPTVASSF